MIILFIVSGNIFNIWILGSFFKVCVYWDHITVHVQLVKRAHVTKKCRRKSANLKVEQKKRFLTA